MSEGNSAEGLQSDDITHAERIHDLCSIDADVTAMLHSGGRAVEALTGGLPIKDQVKADTTEEGSDTAYADKSLSGQSLTKDGSEIKRAFGTENDDYLVTLQSIQARLRRQAYALEEAGIIHARSSRAVTSTVGTQKGEAQITNGGLGNFDVGWLNSRRDEVGKIKEAELWREVRERLETKEDAEEQDSAMDIDVTSNDVG